MAEEIAADAGELAGDTEKFAEFGENISKFTKEFSEEFTKAETEEARQEAVEKFNAKIKEISLEAEKQFQKNLKEGIDTDNIDKIFDILENMDGNIDELKNQIDDLKNEVGQEVLEKFHETLKGRFEALDKSTTEVLEKLLDSKDFKEIKEQLNELKELSKDLSKDLEEKSQEQIDQLRDSIDKQFEEINKKLDEKLKTQLEGKLGVDGYSKFKSMLKYGPMLLYGLGILAAFFVLKSIADELTGCYQYRGTESHKINYCNGKPSRDCNCGPSENNDKTNTSELCENSDNKNYPYCTCGPTPDKPTCTSMISADKTSVYYSYKEFTPSSIIASIPNEIGKFFSLIPKGIEDFLMKTMKIILMIGGLFLLLYLVYIIVSGVISKRNNK